MKPHPQRLATGVVSAGLLASALTAPSTAVAQQPPPVADPPVATQPAAPPPAPAQPAPPAAQDLVPLPPPKLDPTSPMPRDNGAAPIRLEPQTTKKPPRPQAPSGKRPRKPPKATETKGPARKPAAGSSASEPDPALLDAMPGEIPAGVPSFFIDSFRIPVFLLPIYQAAGIQYGVRWEILAAINEIETDYGRNLNVSSAGAQGWMQFMPATWQAYGVDANRDGRADPSNPIDAIFAAARYLQAAGAQTDLRKALFAYNHADWYVNDVLRRAQLLGGLPADLVSSLSGLAQGRPPLLGDPRRVGPADGGRARSLVLRARDGKPAVAVAVADGRVTSVGRSARLGRFVRLRDDYGNRYTYGGLKRLAPSHPTLARRGTKGVRTQTAPAPAPAPVPAPPAAILPGGPPGVALAAIDWAERARRLGILAPAAPATPAARPVARPSVSAYDQRLLGGVATARIAMRPLRRGSRVVAGTILGRSAATPTSPAKVRFEIRPAGRNAPRIDPRPIIAGWKLLLTSNSGAPALAAARQPAIGEVLLLGKQALQRLVLSNPAIALYPCGRDDVRAGRVDRRVLATLQFLAGAGLRPTVSSLSCGHSRLTSSGNVSEHTSGNAVDIAAINGVPILGNQGAGSITEKAIQQLLSLQGTMQPHQIISLMTFDGAANTLAMADHADHIHVGFTPQQAPGSPQAQLFDASLDSKAWRRLIDRLAAIGNPRVATTPSPAAILTAPSAPRRTP